jgi:hypothetical protein
MRCDREHEFEAWFASSADFDAQKAKGFVTCPVCNSARVDKLLMAPNVTTGRQKDETRALVMDTARREIVDKMREVVREIRASADDVGDRFPDEARKIHYGETEARGIVGNASFEEAEALIEEGIEIAALPIFPEDGN